MHFSKTKERDAKARRENALTRNELRQTRPYIKVEERYPEINRPVVAYANDGELIYKLPFPCCYRGPDPANEYRHRWSNLKHERNLECVIVGWHYVA
jgi:hypothetical protein